MEWNFAVENKNFHESSFMRMQSGKLVKREEAYARRCGCNKSQFYMNFQGPDGAAEVTHAERKKNKKQTK